MARLKNLTEAEYYAYISDHGHVLRVDEDGVVDIFGMDFEYHNGPICTLCRDSWCHHCRDDVDVCRGERK